MNDNAGPMPTDDPKERLKKRWRKRSQVLVDSRMQLHFLKVWVAGAVLIVAALAAFLVYSPLSGFILGEAQEIKVVRGDLLRVIFLGYAIMVLFACAMGMYAVLRLHKIAGAVFAMRRVLGRGADGELAVRVELREGDDLVELAEDINHLLAMRDKEMQDLSRAAEIASSLRGVIELDPGDREHIQKLAAKLSRTIEGVEEAEAGGA